MARNVLFGCGSVYQLMNAVILAKTEFAEDRCELVLANYTPWNEAQVANLENSGVFSRVSRYDAVSFSDRFFALSQEKRAYAYRHPGEFFGNETVAEEMHDVLCFGVDHVPWMMHYHYCAQRGKCPEVHMFDEGVRSYTRELSLAENMPYARGAFGRDTFYGAIKCQYLHRPELYAAKASAMAIRPIPGVLHRDDVQEALFGIFGKEALPKERYIYLEDFFFADRFRSNDFALFSEFAKIVGEENIIVKRHPRDDANRFAHLACKEFADSVVPWEIQMLCNDYSCKVLVSVTSTSLLTPVLIFDYPFHVISLEKMFVGENHTHGDVAFQSFMDRFKRLANDRAVRFHTPSTIAELRDVVTYLNLVQP